MTHQLFVQIRQRLHQHGGNRSRPSVGGAARCPILRPPIPAPTPLPPGAPSEPRSMTTAYRNHEPIARARARPCARDRCPHNGRSLTDLFVSLSVFCAPLLRNHHDRRGAPTAPHRGKSMRVRHVCVDVVAARAGCVVRILARRGAFIRPTSPSLDSSEPLLSHVHIVSSHDRA